MKTVLLKFYFVVTASIVIVVGCSHNQPAPATEATIKEATGTIAPDGRQLFTDKCVACHGEDGAAGIAGAANLKTLSADSLTIIKTISNGKNAMPAFGNVLTPHETEQVAVYVKTLSKTKFK